MKKLFEDSEHAFAYKSDGQLRKAYWLFKMMKYNWLISLGTSFILAAIKWRLPVISILKNTLYNQFVGGETLEKATPVVNGTARQHSFLLGVKLVRGAYMEKERARALEKNESSPIQPDKSSTDVDFNKAIDFCFNHLEDTSVVVATHNEYSNLHALSILKNRHFEPAKNHVHFSQLFGMSDNITFNLAREGFSVSKYLPYGSVADVIPYLLRRAQENSSVAGQTGRELFLLGLEMDRRSLK